MPTNLSPCTAFPQDLQHLAVSPISSRTMSSESSYEDLGSPRMPRVATTLPVQTTSVVHEAIEQDVRGTTPHNPCCSAWYIACTPALQGQSIAQTPKITVQQDSDDHVNELLEAMIPGMAPAQQVSDAPASRDACSVLARSSPYAWHCLQSQELINCSFHPCASTSASDRPPGPHLQHPAVLHNMMAC